MYLKYTLIAHLSLISNLIIYFLYMGKNISKVAFVLGSFNEIKLDFPGGSVVKNLPVNARDTGGSIPGVGNGNLLQYSCLENSMDRGVWWLQSMGSQRVERE